MSDPSKPQIFGAGLFGSNTSTTSTKPNTFGNTSTTSGAPLFGQTASAGQTSSLFGSGFGGNASAGGDKSSRFDFGAASIGSQPPTSGSSSIFSGFPTAAMQGQKTGLFGAVSSASNAGSLGTPNSSTFPSSQVEASTPISKPGAAFSFQSSTTPVGPPPSDTGVGTNLSSKLNTSSPKDTAQPTMGDSNTTTAPSNAFGGFPAISSSQSQGSASLFNNPSNSSGSSVLSKPANSESGIFSNLNSLKDNQSLALTTSSSFFTSQSGHSSGATSSAQTSSSPLFGGLSQNNSTGASKASGPTSSLFSKPMSSPTSMAPSTASGLSGASEGQGKSLRMSAPLSNDSKFGMLKDSTTKSTDEIKNLGQTSAEQALPAPAAKSSLFSGAAQPAVIDNTANQNPNLGASTTGPTPPTQSRLKNKSMDEIITRWASDLSKYQKEFQKQAEQVSAWDRMLVENSEKIQKLYGSTLEAERATTEVERQLTAVENDQEELATWLDHYEKEVNQMMSTQVVQGESLHGPDQDRERT